MKGMVRILFSLIVIHIFPITTIISSEAGELPPPDTIGACCLASELGLCQEVTIEECFTDELGFGWSDELTCETDTCIPDTQGDGDCCIEHNSTACESLECSEEICSFDPYCCIFEWDDICVEEAREFCGDLCPQGPAVTVPTLGEWGMIITIFLIGFCAVVRIKKQEYTKI